VNWRCDDEALAADKSVPGWWTEWHDDPTALTTDDGHFVIHGFGTSQFWTMSLWNDEFQGTRDLPATPGKRDHFLRVVRGADPDGVSSCGGLVGSLLLDPAVPRSAIRVEAVRAGANADGHRLDGGGPSGTGWDSSPPGDRFGSPATETGHYDVIAKLREIDRSEFELARLQDVRVEKGKTTSLPPIDLRGSIAVKRVAIVDRGGTPLLGGYVLRAEHSAGSADDWFDYEYFHEGELFLCAIDEWPKLAFMADGFRRVTHRFQGPGDEVVVLPPALQVRVALPKGVALPPAPLTLDVQMRLDSDVGAYVSGASRPPNSDAGTFGESGVVELGLPAAGRYTLELHVSFRESGPGFSRWRGYDVKPDESVVLEDVDEPTTLRLDVDSDAVARAVKELGF
jgi:hypothetical protein